MVNELAWNVLARRFVCGGLWLAVLLALTPAAWADPGFATSLDRNTITLGETAVLSLTFTDCPDLDQPGLPPIDGIEFGATGMNQQYAFGTGAGGSSSVTYTQELRPTHTGVFIIPALSITVNGAQLNSRTLRLNVINAQASVASGPAFLRLVPGATTIYLGQTIPVDVTCYFQNNVSVHMRPAFSSDSFSVGSIPANYSRSRSRMGDAIYDTLTFRVPITPSKTGTFTLGPATWTVTVNSGQPAWPFGWTGGGRDQTFNSDTPEIRVLPVPTAGAPPTFTGAIGSFTLAQYEAGPLSVGVGDPITLKIRITGSGSFDTVRLPVIEQGWHEFTTYPPSSKLDSTDPLQIEGSKYFEQVVVPLNAEIKELPPFVFSFFDPSRGTFRTLSHPAIPLSVHPTATTPQPTIIASGAPPPDAQQQNQDIVHIKPFPGNIRHPGPPLVEQRWFLLLQAVPPLAWMGALMWRRQKAALANNPRLRRRRAVERLVQEGLAGLARAAQANEPENFYSTVLRLLQEQLGERLDLPAPAITEAVAEDLRDLDDAAKRRLRELFQACDQYRYTPEHSSQELASLIPKVKETLADLRKIHEPGRRKKMPQVAVALLLLATLATARAESADDTFARANKFYEEGKYPQAAAVYEGLLRQGNISPGIYFNAGNSWFKAGQVGRAIYDYRRAEQLAPRDPDIRANLDIARAKAGTTRAALPGNRWTRWVGRATLNEWAAAAAAAAALFFIVLTARQISPGFARSANEITLLLALASLWLLACLGFSIDQRLVEKSSIVIVPEAVARLGPLNESQSAFTVPDGAELIVLTRDGDWLQVSDATRRIGWLQQRDVAQIP